MGRLENDSRRRKRKADLKRLVLGTVATTGIIGVAAVAPNVLSVMGKMGLVPNKRQKEFIARSRDRLVRRGLLKYEHGSVRLTSAGERELRILELGDYPVNKPRRWDGKWRVLIFDIPEKRKRLRERVRRTLEKIGFERLQDSVWIYPYDCEDLIVLLKADFRVGKDLLYLIVESLERDQALRRTFGLLR